MTGIRRTVARRGRANACAEVEGLCRVKAKTDYIARPVSFIALAPADRCHVKQRTACPVRGAATVITYPSEHLVDRGSKSVPERTFSFLGELKAIVLACQTTNPLRGDLSLLIRTDDQAVAEQLNAATPSLKDKRVMRLLGWLLGNEDFIFEFVPGAEN